MIKRLKSIINKCSPLLLIALLLLVWQGVCMAGLLPGFMLPSPAAVLRAFFTDFPLLMRHAGVTLSEAFLGLFAGLALAFVTACWMDRWALLYRAAYPVLVLTQTVPTVAIAPLLVLWMGYGMAPKITLIVIVCYFPVTVGLLEGFRSADGDAVRLMRAMGASRGQIFRCIKFPSSLGRFFAGLRVAVPYAMVGGVIAEWLGGYEGLGVYMTRVKKSYAFDKMFAVIFLISFISLLLMKAVDLLQRVCMPWDKAPAGRAGATAKHKPRIALEGMEES